MCLEGTSGEQWGFQSGLRMRRSLIPVIPVCTSSTPAFHQQHHCFYLGVKKQRGGSQVLLLEGTHGVCHLPLLHPAGQQHRGLHTPQAAPHSHTGLKLHTALFSYSHKCLTPPSPGHYRFWCTIAPQKALEITWAPIPSFGQWFFNPSGWWLRKHFAPALLQWFVNLCCCERSWKTLHLEQNCLSRRSSRVHSRQPPHGKKNCLWEFAFI